MELSNSIIFEKINDDQINMKIKSLLAALTFVVSCNAQESYFWLQPNVYNPATAGFDNKIEATGISSFATNGRTNNSLNYNQQLKAIRSGIGGTFNYFNYGNHAQYRFTSGTINYAFQVIAKENFRWSVGAGISLENDYLRSGFFPSGYLRNQLPFFSLGNIVRWKNHTFQLAFSKLNTGKAQGNAILRTMYSYDWKLNESMELKLAALFSAQNGFHSLVFTPVLKYKHVWVNPSIAFNEYAGVAAGVDLKEKLRLGIFYHDQLSRLNNNMHGNNFGLMASFRIKAN